VNGVYHKTVVWDDKLYVIDGYRNIKMVERKYKFSTHMSSGYNICLADTKSLGGHTTLPITENMITKITEDTPLSQGFYITLPEGHVFNDKTCILSLNGYTSIINTMFKIISPNRLKVYSNKIDWI